MTQQYICDYSSLKNVHAQFDTQLWSFERVLPTIHVYLSVNKLIFDLSSSPPNPYRHTQARERFFFLRCFFLKNEKWNRTHTHAPSKIIQISTFSIKYIYNMFLKEIIRQRMISIANFIFLLSEFATCVDSYKIFRVPDPSNGEKCAIENRYLFV
jgi:hypothetical protein